MPLFQVSCLQANYAGEECYIASIPKISRSHLHVAGLSIFKSVSQHLIPENHFP